MFARANDGIRNSSDAVGSPCMQGTCGTRAKNFNLTINRLIEGMDPCGKPSLLARQR
jgi:hypothetical protein